MEITLKKKRKILEMLNKRGKVRVNELSRIFNVSEVTIRLDLSDLERKRPSIQVYGGAISSYKTYVNMSFKQRATANEFEKGYCIKCNSDD